MPNENIVDDKKDSSVLTITYNPEESDVMEFIEQKHYILKRGLFGIVRLKKIKKLTKICQTRL